MKIVIVVVVLLVVLLPVVAVMAFLKLESRLRRGRRLVEPVAGSVVVTAMSNPTQGDLLPNLGDLLPAHENFVLEGVAHVPGMAPYPIRLGDAAWTNRWPEVGQTVPVLVDRRRPTRVRIRWDDLRAGRP